MKYLLTSCGNLVTLDDEDFDRFVCHTCSLNNSGYARRGTGKIVNGKKVQKGFLLHREILGVTDSKIIVDHINQNKLDNRKCNLRVANRAQNAVNSRLWSTNKTGLKGVRKMRDKWQAYTTHHNRQYSFGVYETREEAALARDLHMIHLHGIEYVALNFPEKFSVVADNK